MLKLDCLTFTSLCENVTEECVVPVHEGLDYSGSHVVFCNMKMSFTLIALPYFPQYGYSCTSGLFYICDSQLRVNI